MRSLTLTRWQGRRRFAADTDNKDTAPRVWQEKTGRFPTKYYLSRSARRRWPIAAITRRLSACLDSIPEAAFSPIQSIFTSKEQRAA